MKKYNFGKYILDKESILLTLLLYKFNWVKLKNVSPDKTSIVDILLRYNINCFNEFMFAFLNTSKFVRLLLSKYNSSNLFDLRFKRRSILEILFSLTHNFDKLAKIKSIIL